MQIIHNILVTLKLNQQLKNFSQYNKSDADEKLQLDTINNLKKDIQEITLPQNIQLEHNDDNRTNDVKYLEKLKNLVASFYFIATPSLFDESKDINSNAASGVIKIGATKNHPFKYTYYQPISELEYRTEIAEDFLILLRNMNHEFNFYALDGNADTLVLPNLEES